MAQTLRFMDSFDHYTTQAQLTQKWTAGGPVSYPTIGAWGRNGTNGLKFVGARDTVYLTIPGGGSPDVVAGVAINPVVVAPWLGVGNAEFVCIDFRDAVSLHIRVQMDPVLHVLKLWRGNAGGDAVTLLATGSRVLQLNTWYSVEIAVHIHDSTGTVKVKINELLDIDFTGDTRTSGTDVNIVALGHDGGAGGTQDWRADDFFVAGGGSSTFYGDCRVECIFPTAAGAYSQFSPNGAGANYTKVDEVTPNDDTDYNASSTVGHRDSYEYGDLSAISAAIKAVQFSSRARTDDEGTRILKAFYRKVASGTDYDSPNSYSLSSAYSVNVGDIMENDPSGGTWTLAKVNAAQFGIKVNA